VTLPNARRVKAVPITAAERQSLEGRAILDDLYGGDWPVAGFEHSPEQIVEAVRAAGLVGMGGAAFPTHVKLTANPKRPVDTLVVNGCECEPYLTSDHRLMLEAAGPIVAGALLAAHAAGAERTIVASGASKTYSWTGGRIGWGIYPTVEEAKVQRRLNINYFASIPPYNQMGVKTALQSPESPAAIARMVDAFERRRDVVVSGLNGVEGITCQNPLGAFYVFPNISGVLERLGGFERFEALPAEVKERSSPATLLQLFLLYHYRVATMDRRSFGILGSEGEHYLRISIATGEADLREAVDRIATAAKDVEGFTEFVTSGRRLTL
jgi:hypothetical protein